MELGLFENHNNINFDILYFYSVISDIAMAISNVLEFNLK